MFNPALINRHTVSKNFRCKQNQSDLVFDYDHLIDLINYWKAIFIEKHRLKSGDKIGLGYSLVDIYYFGAVFAAAEIGLRIVILDDVYSKSKVAGFYPLDLFVKGPSLQFLGVEDLEKNSLRMEQSSIFDNYEIKLPERFTDYVTMTCYPDDTLMCCTSSGTTDTPKLINHTHSFLSAVSERNARLFDFKGNICHVQSLHHGSSLATYFLPSLMSDDCVLHHIFPIKTEEQVRQAVGYFVENKINHVQLSYRKNLENFLLLSVEQKACFDDLTIHTLGYIDPSWQASLKQIGNVKLISIFGSNETSGPIFTNELTADSTEFDPKKFFLCDDFYRLEKTTNNQLAVTLPQYDDTTIIMQDAFEIVDDEYRHLGRSDMFRIGEIVIDANWLLTLTNNMKINGDLVFDKIQEKIYYANWDKSNEKYNVSALNKALMSKYRVSISSWKTLDYRAYLYGIKIDHDLIRETFRNEM